MLGIDKGVKIYVYENAESELKNVMTKSLVDFIEWYKRAEERNAKILQNGMNSVIVITENRYFVARTC